MIICNHCDEELFGEEPDYCPNCGGEWTQGGYTEEEIQENVERRIEIAVDLLEQHPYTVNTWSSAIGRELTASFKLDNPDTDIFETMLGLEEYGAYWIDSDEREYVDDNGLVVVRGWDVPHKYFYFEKDGEEVPFTEWSDDYEWDIGSWQQTIEEFLNEAGWSKDD